MIKLVEQLRKLPIVGRTLAMENNINLMPAFNESIGCEGVEEFDNFQLLR